MRTNRMMWVDYQRITDEMYESRKDREPQSNKLLIAGLLTIVALPIAALLYFGYLFLTLTHELRGF